MLGKFGRSGLTEKIEMRVSPHLAVLLVASLLGCAPAPAPSTPAPPPPQAAPSRTGRPLPAITTTQAFDVASIPRYARSHPEIYSYIDRNQNAHIEQLRRWVRQPSISAENRGIREMANLLREDLKQLGFQEAELVPTSGHPGVWGYYDAGAAKTLAVYMMYDVQPVEPSDWRVPPFDGAIVDHALGRVLMARGATNQKGPERAFLNAVASIRAVTGKLPVNLMIVAEGEEELGSPHFPEVIARYEARLRRADGVLFPFPSQTPTGDVSTSLGVKGIVYFEMEASGARSGGPTRAEVHGSLKALADAPAWRLVQALSTLTSPDGNTITVPGYYDAIRPPNDEEQRLVNGYLAAWQGQEQQMRDALAIPRWVGGASGRESLLQYLFTTTLNIDGIGGGYTGPGVKTILPHRAVAKLDSRLVPNQTPDEALRLIRQHLDARGFRDIEIRQLSGYPPAQTSVSAALVRAGLGVYNKYDRRTTVTPRIAGSAPYYVFTQRLGLPLFMGGLGYGAGAHAPNEFFLIEPREGSRVAGLAEVEKFYVDLLHALAEMK
jgi:acetylornithine deacetylase/succinyl-diaminopimelate desuccinylase-like protein